MDAQHSNPIESAKIALEFMSNLAIDAISRTPPSPFRQVRICLPALFAIAFLFAIAPEVRAQQFRVEGAVPGFERRFHPDRPGRTARRIILGLHDNRFFRSIRVRTRPADSGTVVVNARGFDPLEKAWTAATNNPARLDITLVPSAVNQSIIVTATRSQTLLSDVPLSDIQLTRVEVQAIPALTLDDTLRQVPGFSLFRRSSSRTANPTAQGVSLRGLGASGSSRALVLEDGIPLNDPFGAWVYWDRVPRESISDIEIAQEGSSSLYGSDALGGVIQVLTRAPEPAGISLETSYGNQNSPELSVWGGAQKNGWESTFGGQVFNTDGYTLIPEKSARKRRYSCRRHRRHRRSHGRPQDWRRQPYLRARLVFQ